MGNEVEQLHGQPRAAKKPQQEQGQGAAGMPQECLGWVKRPQGRSQVTWNWARAATEPQETWVVAQLPKTKVHGVAKPLPQAAELL